MVAHNLAPSGLGRLIPYLSHVIPDRLHGRISSAYGFAAKVEGAKLENMLDSDWFDLTPGLGDAVVEQDGSGILGGFGFTFLP